MSGPDDLVAPEGVDDGSAAQTAEAERPATSPATSPGPRSAGVPARQPSSDRTTEGGGDDVLGEPPHGAPDDSEQDAAPVEAESPASRRSRDERGPGQQVQAGEG